MFDDVSLKGGLGYGVEVCVQLPAVENMNYGCDNIRFLSHLMILNSQSQVLSFVTVIGIIVNILMRDFKKFSS